MLRETIEMSPAHITESGAEIAQSRPEAIANESRTALAFLDRAKSQPNPYLNIFETVQADPVYKEALAIARGRTSRSAFGLTYQQAHEIQETTRHTLTHKYSWAVPNQEALGTIAEQGPLIEAGAGSGYWSHLLKKIGADIVSFDQHGSNVAENYYHRSAKTAWTDILQGNEGTVAHFPDRSLFMSFPPAGEPFAKNVLDNYSGKRLAFVGELGCGSCTGDRDFHSALESDWREVKSVALPNWEVASGYLWDQLHLFERK